MTQEQQNELDYMISVIQAKKDGKQLEIRPKGSNDDSLWDNFNTHHWDFAYWEIRVKPEPKTVPFSFEDADFLIGINVKSDSAYFVITNVHEKGFALNGSQHSYSSDSVSNLKYQDPDTLEWRLFVKTIQ